MHALHRLVQRASMHRERERERERRRRGGEREREREVANRFGRYRLRRKTLSIERLTVRRSEREEGKKGRSADRSGRNPRRCLSWHQEFEERGNEEKRQWSNTRGDPDSCFWLARATIFNLEFQGRASAVLIVDWSKVTLPSPQNDETR